MTTSEQHIPVLMREAIEALNIRDSGVYVDATLGRAGHAQQIAQQIGENGKLICFDRDPRAIELGCEVFKDDERVNIIHSEFSRMAAVRSS